MYNTLVHIQCFIYIQTDRALEDVKMYRAKNQEEHRITDVNIYNLILRGLGKEVSHIRNEVTISVNIYIKERPYFKSSVKMYKAIS